MFSWATRSRRVKGINGGILENNSIVKEWESRF